MDAAEVLRLHAAKLTPGQIAQVLNAPLVEVKAVLAEEARHRAERNYQMRQAQKEIPALPVPWPFARGSEETPLHYAERVLKQIGELPAVSLIPSEKIRRANIALKIRGYPQIGDRAEWLV